jgi:hypothetical protein
MTTTTPAETMTTSTPAETTTATTATTATTPAVIASLPAQILAAVAVAASRDDAKQVLQCIHVTTAGGWLALAAVDGHRLITVRVPQSEHLYITTDELLLSADSMRKPGGKAQTIEINRDGNFQSVDAMGRPVGAGVWRHPYGSGTFPNYEQLIPDTFTNAPKGAVTVNASYLLDWCKVCAAVTVKDKQFTSWQTNSPTSPMVWTAKVDPRLIPGDCDDDVVMRHLLMPVQVRH